MSDAASDAASKTLPRVHLAPVTRGDRAPFIELVRRSRRFLRPFAHPPADVTAFDAWLASRARDPERHRSFLVRAGEGPGRIEKPRVGDTTDDPPAPAPIVGVINLNEIVRGVFQSAYLGYYALGAEGRGAMTAGMRIVLAEAFGPMKLHRLEANIQPENTRSIALVKRCGFRLEGYSPRYLKIGGRWRDHERWAILAGEWRANRRGR